ncbi:MAG: M23 family metallopeptidase [Lachnospiraceae bacterium]|nr:M23 family metallopeptidase [Lachnospiraceae bacterium]
MKKMSKENLEHIKSLFEENCGVNLKENTSKSRVKEMKFYVSNQKSKICLATCMTLCFLSFAAFGFAKFSGLSGDDASFSSAYQGDGVIKLTVSNQSDKILQLQKQLKLMQWSTGEEIQGEKDKIVYSDMSVNPGEEKEIIIDLSLAYDVQALEEKLDEKDHYYFVLTNNDFAFGQDWMCSVDFEAKDIDISISNGRDETHVDGTISVGVDNGEKESYVQPSFTAPLVYADWTWPTVCESVTSKFGVPRKDTMTDHINIRGEKGDDIYAVADGEVLETGFDSSYGNYVILDLGNKITVKYGHLKDIDVETKERVKKGQKIATMGATGMATGPNLAFFVYEDGTAVNPLLTEDDM